MLLQNRNDVNKKTKYGKLLVGVVVPRTGRSLRSDAGKNAARVDSLAGCLGGSEIFPNPQLDSQEVSRGYANRNSFARNSLIVSLSLAAFSNSNRFAASRMSLSSLTM